ncbi:MAG: type VI secretion system baseplate subunit TssK, partial [Planctomycetes bacterium]|nr:type VI secretion system baseplate subunit TssK [Planctomycetota bacterium]
SKWLALLEKAVDTGLSRRPFQPSSVLADAVEVELPVAFLAGDVELYLSVYTDKDQAQVESALVMARLAAPDDLDDCRRMRTTAIQCRKEPNLHPALRQREGQVFVRINKSGDKWESAQRARRLALDIRTLADLEGKYELFATNVRGDG